MQKKITKKGISLMVSYALLVVIAIGLSLFAYAYLKSYLPSKRAECPRNINIFVDSLVCSRTNKTLDITISNRGFFNISAVYLRFGETSRQIRAQLNPGDEILPFPILPGGGSYVFSFNITNHLKDSTSYILEVQPAVISKTEIILCEDSITEFNVFCPS